jgi:hypothetical protein
MWWRELLPQRNAGAAGRMFPPDALLKATPMPNAKSLFCQQKREVTSNGV